MVQLDDYQIQAILDLKNGSILCGGVGSGKSRTALGYYMFKDCEGKMKLNGKGGYEEMKNPRDLYIITTAKKRDTLEWEKECAAYVLSSDRENSHSGVKVTIDSWNNIKKYKDVHSAFFIFDEQRVVGSGVWVKTFLNISRKNHWILLSATPGDQWSDYIPVFVANGFYKNKTDFNNQHAVWSRYTKYPKVDRYIGERKLKQLRDSILVPMKDNRTTVRVSHWNVVDYDKDLYKMVFVNRWDPFENCPIQEASKWYYLQRRVVNSDYSRIEKLKEIFEEKRKIICFYNFDYELEILREFVEENEICAAEWNGHRHEAVPTGDSWIYLVQYTAGCEGWNCITTDTIVFFSQSYSYRTTEQAAGRIDRINTPYEKLHYYYFRSTAFIDMSIYRKMKTKKNFNEDSALFTKFKPTSEVAAYSYPIIEGESELAA